MPIDADSAPAFLLESDAIEIDPAIASAIDQLIRANKATATRIERPTPAAIDPRQFDLFGQPASDSGQPARGLRCSGT